MAPETLASLLPLGLSPARRVPACPRPGGHQTSAEASETGRQGVPAARARTSLARGCLVPAGPAGDTRSGPCGGCPPEQRYKQ